MHRVLARIGNKALRDKARQNVPECPVCGEKGYNSTEECSFCEDMKYSKENRLYPCGVCGMFKKQGENCSHCAQKDLLLRSITGT